jgi:hypothetical protein
MTTRPWTVWIGAAPSCRRVVDVNPDAKDGEPVRTGERTVSAPQARVAASAEIR